SAGFARGQKTQEPTPKSGTTMAIVPWVFENGTKGAISTSKEYLNTVLSKSGIEVIPEGRVVAAWTKDIGTDLDSEKRSLPMPKQMLALGEKLGVNWVMAGRSRWHTRSIWVTLGPKTKSDCTVDMMIVDVNKGEVVLDQKAVRMDSTAKEDALKAA